MLEQLAVELLFKSVQQEARQDGRYLMLEYGRSVKVVAAAFAMLPFVLGWLAVSGDEAGWMEYLIIVGFGILALYLILETFFYRIRFDSLEIIVESPWRERRSIPWCMVVELSYSERTQYHVLHTNGLGGIKVSTLLSGRGALLLRFFEMRRHDDF